LYQYILTNRTEVKRRPDRADYRPQSIEAILDEGFVAHVGFAVDGQPYVIPMVYARDAQTLYLHGSPASRLLRGLRRGIPVCVTVTLLDGLVLARSAFHHSMNYRSVVIFGTATVVDDPAEKLVALRAFSDHVIPDRWSEVREPNPTELKSTLVLRLPLVEVSAKVRIGPPLDDDADYELATWAGEVPLRLVPETPIPDSRLPKEIEVPPSVRNYIRGTKES